MKYKRIFLIVADSLGIGAALDASSYGDEGANTLKHLSYAKEDFFIPNLCSLGLGNLTKVNKCKPNFSPLAAYGKMRELSKGKDTLTGHWEMMGLKVISPFPAFSENGFPPELVKKLEEETKHKFMGNISASGTEIIKDLGEEHLKTKALILYTSADSVLQIAANEEIIPLEELYRVCEIARKITLDNPAWAVGRIIARPFIGKTSATFQRTANRHDYAVKPNGRTVLNELAEEGYDVIALGKIRDIFDGEGITYAQKTISNDDGMDKIITMASKDFKGLVFLNLVDFDALYGHRRDALGYARAVEAFDRRLGELLKIITPTDLLIITADHGNDPRHHGTDHTREYVPLLVYSPTLSVKDLGKRKTFADIGATIAKNFEVKTPKIGTSFI